MFWILFGTFWICGWSTNGLIGTHFIPAAHDHGMPATTSAGLLALIGIFDIIGTVASGWLTDRVDTRYLLFGYYFFRGLSLLVVPYAARPARRSRACSSSSSSTAWTGWPRCRRRSRCAASTSAIERSGVVFGWVFAAHMVGAGSRRASPAGSGPVQGDYCTAWLTAGGLCLAAAVACLLIPRSRWRRRPDEPPAQRIWRTRGTSVKIVRLLRRVAGVHHTS